MFNFSKLLYKRETFTDITFTVESNGFELCNPNSKSEVYILFQNIQTVEHKKRSSALLKIIASLIIMVTSLVSLTVLQTIFKTFFTYGYIQIFSILAITVSLGYLIGISVIYLGTKYELFVQYPVLINAENIEISLIYETKKEQQEAYNQIKTTLEKQTPDKVPYVGNKEL